MLLVLPDEPVRHVEQCVSWCGDVHDVICLCHRPEALYLPTPDAVIHHHDDPDHTPVS